MRLRTVAIWLISCYCHLLTVDAQFPFMGPFRRFMLPPFSGARPITAFSPPFVASRGHFTPIYLQQGHASSPTRSFERPRTISVGRISGPTQRSDVQSGAVRYKDGNIITSSATAMGTGGTGQTPPRLASRTPTRPDNSLPTVLGGFTGTPRTKFRNIKIVSPRDRLRAKIHTGKPFSETSLNMIKNPGYRRIYVLRVPNATNAQLLSANTHPRRYHVPPRVILRPAISSAMGRSKRLNEAFQQKTSIRRLSPLERNNAIRKDQFNGDPIASLVLPYESLFLKYPNYLKSQREGKKFPFGSIEFKTDLETGRIKLKRPPGFQLLGKSAKVKKISPTDGGVGTVVSKPDAGKKGLANNKSKLIEEIGNFIDLAEKLNVDLTRLLEDDTNRTSNTVKKRNNTRARRQHFTAANIGLPVKLSDVNRAAVVIMPPIKSKVTNSNLEQNKLKSVSLIKKAPTKGSDTQSSHPYVSIPMDRLVKTISSVNKPPALAASDAGLATKIDKHTAVDLSKLTIYRRRKPSPK